MHKDKPSTICKGNKKINSFLKYRNRKFIIKKKTKGSITGKKEFKNRKKILSHEYSWNYSEALSEK